MADPAKQDQQKKEFQGIYAHGKLEGVDFTVAGSGTDDKGNPMKWDSSIHLNLSTLETITKEANGVKIPTLAKRSFLIKIACDTDVLEAEVKKWNEKKDEMLHLRLQPSKNATFKISEDT